MEIRRAIPADAAKILDLLSQVEHVHYLGRPDIFKLGGTKFTEPELISQMRDDLRPIFVAVEDGEVVGYTFCIISEIHGSTMLNDAKVLHLEDVCVDSERRGMSIGSALMDFCKSYARNIGCTRIDLDVWDFNDGALRFYLRHGFQHQKHRMDMPL